MRQHPLYAHSETVAEAPAPGGDYEPRGKDEWQHCCGFSVSTMGALLLFWFQLQELNVPNVPRRYCQAPLARTTREKLRADVTISPKTLTHFPSSATDRGAFEYTPGRSGWADMWLKCD